MGEGHRDDTGDWLPWHCHWVFCRGGVVFKVSKQRGYRKPDEDRRYGGLFWRAGGRFWKRGMADAGPGAYLPGHGLRSNEGNREDEQGYDARILLVLHYPSVSGGNFAGRGGRVPLYVRTQMGAAGGYQDLGICPGTGLLLPVAGRIRHDCVWKLLKERCGRRQLREERGLL